MKTLKVYSVNSRVLVGGSIEAKVIGVGIRANDAVMYEVVWWDNNVRHQEWLQAAELKPFGDNQSSRRIGFQ